MITQILTENNFDPTAIIGGKLNFIGGNSRVGKSNIMVCEACEYVDTFLHLHPAISVILNMEADHLDYFKCLENIKHSFHQFALQTTQALFVNGDDKNIASILHEIDVPIITFGFHSTNNYSLQPIADNNNIYGSFVLLKDNIPLTNISMKIPGTYNRYNALAAIAVSHSVGVSPEGIAKSLQHFNGVHRRFEVLGQKDGITVVDDFAHHPTELRATLTTAKAMKYNRVIAIFQPHTYSRTYAFLDEFAQALSIADQVILSEILAVREENTYNIYAKDLAKKIKNCVWFQTFEEIAQYTLLNIKPGDLVITMGGGNIYECAHTIWKQLKERGN